jgi:hypothetical protein
MNSPGKILKMSKRVLNELHSESTQDFLDLTNILLEELENKIDPDPQELYIAENIYQLKEKLKIMEDNLRTFVLEQNKSLPGNKLSELLSPSDND